MSKGQALQDPFLNALRKERIPVSIYLVNGIKLQGQVESFDQFVVLLKNTPYGDAMDLAEKLRAALNHSEIMFKGKQLSVSASFGVTTLKDMNYRTPEEML